MPIDYDLPLKVDHPTFITPLQAQADQLSLKQLAGQVAIQNQVQKENDLKLQAADEDRADEKAWGEIFVKHGGKDWDAAITEATPRLRIRNLNKIKDQHLQEQKGAMEMATADRINGTANMQNALFQNDLIKQEFDALDQTPDADKNDFWKLGRQRLRARGVPEHVIAQFDQALPEIAPDGSDNHKIQSLATVVARRGSILTDAQKKEQIEKTKADAAKSQALADATAAKAARDAEHEEARDAAQSHLLVQTEEDHQAWLNEIKDPILRKKLSNYKFNPDKPEQTQEALDKFAMTYAERAKIASDKVIAADKAADNARQSAQATETERHNRALETAAMLRAKNTKDSKTGLSDTDRRAYMRDLSSLKEEEEKIAGVRSALENAITGVLQKDGTRKIGAYVKENGESVDMATAARAEDTTVDALISRMKLRYRDLSNKMKRVVEDKNTFGQALGAQIGVPTEKVHKAIDDDDQRVIPDIAKKKETPAVGSGATPPVVTPAATVAKPAEPVADPSIKEKGGYKVNGEYETKDGRKFTLKGFTKDGKMIPAYK